MLSDKERIAKLEKQVDALTEISEREEREAEIKEEVAKFIKEQEKGAFSYSKDAFKAVVILAAMYAGGSKALDVPWIKALLN